MKSQPFDGSAICSDNRRIPVIVFSEGDVWTLTPVLSMDANSQDSFVNLLRELKREKSDERWEILNPRIVGTVIQFEVKPILPEYSGHSSGEWKRIPPQR